MKFAIVVVSLYAIVAASAQSCGRPTIRNSVDDRIIGGQVATKGSWPWTIHLGYKSWIFGSTQFICGGSILSNRWIVTAAHCIEQDLTASKYTIRVGQHDSSQQESHARNYEVKRIIKHPLYSSDTTDNDIALIEVTSNIAFTDHVGAVCLPTSLSDPAHGTSCVAKGWGETSPQGRLAENQNTVSSADVRAVSTILRQVNVNVVKRATCNLGAYYGGAITANMICAGTTGKDSCQGDSGGPFVCRSSNGAYALEGIVSWGIGCGAANKPGVYTRTGNYITWIKQNTGL